MPNAGLQRFVLAQANVWPRPLEEVRAGRKTSHWMWFVFPQLRGLGHSPMAQLYGIADLPEARAYLAHPVLGPRLDEIARAALAHAGTPCVYIMGKVDTLKLRSCATLFEAAGPPDAPFAPLLETFFDGERCPRTLEMLGL